MPCSSSGSGLTIRGTRSPGRTTKGMLRHLLLDLAKQMFAPMPPLRKSVGGGMIGGSSFSDGLDGGGVPGRGTRPSECLDANEQWQHDGAPASDIDPPPLSVVIITFMCTMDSQPLELCALPNVSAPFPQAPFLESAELWFFSV